MKMLLILATILLLNASLGQAQVCSYDLDTDYYGSDLTYVFTQRREDCCTLCATYPGCGSFSYVPLTKACWLKSAVVPIKVQAIGRTILFKKTMLLIKY